jgi:subtilisin family serine protease
MRRLTPVSHSLPVICGLVLFGACIWGLVSFPAASHAALQQSSATKEKTTRPEYVAGEILVRFRAESPVVATKAGLQSELSVEHNGRQTRVRLERLSAGAEVVRGLRIARVAPEDTIGVIEALRLRSDVIYAEPNYIVRKLQLPNDLRFNEQWNLRNTTTPTADIDAEQAWDITTGSHNVVVGVIDEGIDISHEDLAANIWTNPSEIAGNGIDDDNNGRVDDLHGWDFFHNDNTVYDGPGTNPDGSEVDAHGTHVAGIIGAVGNNGIGVAGVNWQVTMVPLKFLGPDGGTTIDVVKAYEYAVNLKQAWESSGGTRGANVRILNNSYGGRRASQAALDEIRALNDAGILFVTAAGNDARASSLIASPFG